MSSNKKKIIKASRAAAVRCGCGSVKLSDVFEPTPFSKLRGSTTSIISKKCLKQCSPVTVSSCDDRSATGFSMSADKEIEEEEEEEEGFTSTTMSYNVDNNTPNTTTTTTTTQNSESETDPAVRGSRIVDSVAVVKESGDPYQDFKHSMLHMIFEKEIYSNDDLQDLLRCFLELNSPCHHEVIVQAFTEIWNEIISKTRSRRPSVSRQGTSSSKSREHITFT